MPVSRVTAAQFEQAIAQNIAKRDATIDTTTGPVRNVVIRPVARVLESQNARVREVYQLLALLGVNDLKPEDVDAFVFTEQVLRSTGTPAFVNLVFSRASKPTSDITVPPNYPVGTDVDPDTGVRITFITQQAATMIAANAGAYFNPQTGRYELVVPAASTTSGPTTRVGRNRVVRPLRPLVNFDQVFNRDEARGGLPAEINSDLASRYFLRIQGTEIGTPPGLARYIRQVFGNVQNLLVVYGNDPFLTRADVDAGAVDVWVLGSTPLERTMTVPYPGPLVRIPFDRQPGIGVVSVVSGGSFVENVDFQYAPDTTEWSRSTRGQDGIVFLPTGAQPALGAPVQITFTYDNLIASLQAFFGKPEYKETGRDELFRRGIEVPIAITAQLRVNAGDPNQVLAQVSQALLDFMNGSTTQAGYGLGEGVEEFDLDHEVARIPGVDNFVFQLLARVGGSGVGDLAMARNEYPRLSPANLSISLF
jgi:hypothetical protein